jgi:hypothetical protein
VVLAAVVLVSMAVPSKQSAKMARFASANLVEKELLRCRCLLFISLLSRTKGQGATSLDAPSPSK